MTETKRVKHWDKIYETKQITEVSWYQPSPKTSLDFISSCNLPKNAAIIDIGAGDSFLVDHLLELGFSDISVLDISLNAINRAKKRLGEKQHLITWIISDITEFIPDKKYDLWHDRAAFHFLTQKDEINTYIQIVSSGLKSNASLIIGAFSKNGPLKCSGIEIQQYSKNDLENVFKENFNLLRHQSIDHDTPFNTIQNFTFCSFIKNK